MDLVITMLNGEGHPLRVQPEDTVGSLKKLIQDKFGAPSSTQKLVFVNGQKIDLSDDSQTIRSYGLQSGSRVSLLLTRPATIQVFVKNDRGRSSTYDIKPDETVNDFKTKVQCREGVQVSQQRLIFQGREMMHGRLSDYGVRELSSIDLNLRLRGG
ncbi:polyubiquitin-like [Anabas testudineus]|uniref:Ubiquitin-like domain-containing protein n=1 Tax=Anabas testudineus TaxID=64144 RepID=A0AAQ6ISC2_ANATE|nr:polyubiquitin-like [Anabas testudineus]XP_026198114.1 polyubiquitin-like [Anabas testudineus]